MRLTPVFGNGLAYRLGKYLVMSVYVSKLVHQITHLETKKKKEHDHTMSTISTQCGAKATDRSHGTSTAEYD